MPSDDDAPGYSLTRQLRELHLRLDPDAPRHMSNGQRKTAIQALLGGTDDDDDGQAKDDRGAARGTRQGQGKAGGKSRQDKGPRQAHGVSLPGNPPAPKPTGSRGTGKPEPANNAERLVRFLFG